MGARADMVLALAWLRTKDPVERELYQEIAQEMIRIKEIVNHNMAVEIANQVGRLFKK